MKILYIAEIVGKAGVYAYKKALPEIKSQKKPDFIIACADGATGGNGLGRNHAAYLHKLGANVLSTGECCFYKKDLTENLEKLPYILRPLNLNPEAPGIGSRIYKINLKNPIEHETKFHEGNTKIAVAVLLGQSGFTRLHGSSPFSGLEALLERLRQETPFVVIDFHAQATAEKQTLFAIVSGKCSAVIGSHCRVQTADDQIRNGTAIITDAGRTGSSLSVGGCDTSSRIQEYVSGIPDWTRDAWEKPELQGVLIDIADNGKARSIERLCWPVPEAPNIPKLEAEETIDE
ncbi:MAG: YmdB family metallophosphoesterase [Treponema sp.]|jgi:metallophosphoesterase (TIGR00282 family)|nr:YmdB family metallophosphoesterase [Treponema sp.]